MVPRDADILCTGLEVACLHGRITKTLWWGHWAYFQATGKDYSLDTRHLILYLALYFIYHCQSQVGYFIEISDVGVSRANTMDVSFLDSSMRY